jgi:hypothetical protein
MFCYDELFRELCSPFEKHLNNSNYCYLKLNQTLVVQSHVRVATKTPGCQKMLGKVLRFSFLVALLAIATHFIRPTFDVHTSGVIVITGTSSGIGRAAAIKFASLGFTVLCGVRKESDGLSLLQSVDGNVAKNIVPTIIDVTKLETIDDAVKRAEAVRTFSCFILVFFFFLFFLTC